MDDKQFEERIKEAEQIMPELKAIVASWKEAFPQR